jgi:hypothetical protein
MGERALISAHKCDKKYGLRNGTAAKFVHARLIKFVERKGPGKYGRVYLIDAADAEREWGAKLHVVTT